MNWIHFLLWVAGIYTLYYLAVILIDVAGTKTVPAAALTNELTFSEQVETQKLEHKPEEEVKPTGNAMIASGGVPIRELFSLARKELIVYTKSVSY
jgi:hypothetical protein